MTRTFAKLWMISAPLAMLAFACSSGGGDKTGKGVGGQTSEYGDSGAQGDSSSDGSSEYSDATSTGDETSTSEGEGQGEGEGEGEGPTDGGTATDGGAATDAGGTTDGGAATDAGGGATDAGGGATDSGTRAPETFNVTVSNFQFSPSALTVHVGDTVVWTWNDGPHSVTSGPPTCAPDGHFDSTLVNAPHTFSQTFTTTGSFPYFCLAHCAMGMTGMITVVP